MSNKTFLLSVASTTLGAAAGFSAFFATLGEDLAVDGVGSPDLTVLMVVREEVVVCGTVEVGDPPVPTADPHELPRKSLPDLGSHNLGTLGGAVGRGVILLGD